MLYIGTITALLWTMMILTNGLAMQALMNVLKKMGKAIECANQINTPMAFHDQLAEQAHECAAVQARQTRSTIIALPVKSNPAIIELTPAATLLAGAR
jgi:hypothetical protein